LEVHGEVVAVARTKDKGVGAACVHSRPRVVHRLEVAPHEIRGISSADETVIPAIGTTTSVSKITDKVVGTACSTYEGIVSAQSTGTGVNNVPDKRIGTVCSAYEGIVPAKRRAKVIVGISDEGISRVCSANEGVIAARGCMTHERLGVTEDKVGGVGSTC